ncbi:MAG: formate dehydrogenase accessory protein FdhE [Desulfobacterales bacterium]
MPEKLSGMAPELLKKAVEKIRQTRPAYAAMLGFYEKLFIVQEQSISAVRIGSILLPPDLVRLKKHEKMPLISKSDFLIDANLSRSLFAEIWEMAADPENGLPAFVSAGKRDIPKPEPDPLFSAVLREDRQVFEKAGQEMGITGQIPEFLAISSLVPSLRVCSHQLSHCLDSDNWEAGYCPICGSMPGLSVLREKGDRHMICSFCRKEWAVSRFLCFTCNTADAKHHQYFYTDEEKEYRVEVCDQCGTYLKTVDIRKMDRFFYPPLEEIVTLHLDMNAQEKGYHSLWAQ